MTGTTTARTKCSTSGRRNTSNPPGTASHRGNERIVVAFYLEGLAHPLNGSGATTVLERPTLIATYFPTSYGAVSGFVTSAESGQFQVAEAITWPIAGDSLSSVTSNQYYKVDLRELEVAAMRARTQAAILDKQLLEAKLQQQVTAPKQ